jgi:hypothetical protein
MMYAPARDCFIEFYTNDSLSLSPLPAAMHGLGKPQAARSLHIAMLFNISV